MTQTIAPAWLWQDQVFKPGLQLQIDAAGRIMAIGPARTTDALVLPRHALLPGFVSAHCHAFQRVLRGYGERFPASSGNFWSWREAMYALVAQLDAQALYDATCSCYLELRHAGVTTVGEFHYLRHDRPGDFALDEIILAAAATIGIRLVLLPAYYERADFDGTPLGIAQQRFATQTASIYWAAWERLAMRLSSSTQSLGVAVHSLRAAPIQAVASIAAEAARRCLPFHLHLEEQPREIANCRSVHGCSPITLLLEHLDMPVALTAVHCTHTPPDQLARLLTRGWRVCVCPTTEANLGDGIPALEQVVSNGHQTQLGLGSDSNATISLLEELRWLEYAQRLRATQRGVLRRADGQVAPVLLAAASRGGASMLGLAAGELVAGQSADLLLIDLDHPSLAGWTEQTLADAICFGARDGCIANSAVGGRWLKPLEPQTAN